MNPLRFTQAAHIARHAVAVAVLVSVVRDAAFSPLLILKTIAVIITTVVDFDGFWKIFSHKNHLVL